MRKRTRLPLFEDESTPPPSESVERTEPSKLEDARNRLGGRTNEEEPGPPGVLPGAIVRVIAKDATKHIAVVVFANSTEVHVLIDGSRLRRVPPASVELHGGNTPSDLSELAADASVFARLVEGQPVRYADDKGNFVVGKLLEKCRYGALVARKDSVIVAVGFRKLWPATSAGAA